MKRDIFISYKNDGEGRNFAARICADLSKLGYSVYYNPHEQHAGSFPERLRAAIDDCRDFLLIVTAECLEQLMRHDEVDWVREELLAAYEGEKNIIPLLMPGVSMPKNKNTMPEDLRFLPDKDAIAMAEIYDKSPLDFLLSWLRSSADQNDVNKDLYNGSLIRSIDVDFDTLGKGAADYDMKAMFERALFYYYGLVGTEEEGCRRDFAKAYELLEIVSNSFSEYSPLADSLIGEMYHLGVVPRESHSYEKALEFHGRAKEESGFSAREYAYLKSRGVGCEYDFNEIEQSYLDAIENGDMVAITGLARIYMDSGQFKKAAELYRRTSHIKSDAEYCLGMLYRNGLLEDPPKPDFFKAAFYFQHAIDSGNCSSDVYHQLGRLYFMPTGDFPKDFRAAERLFKKSAEMGNREAQYKLALIYEYGMTEKNLNDAIKYHTMASERGVAFAAYHLALIYQEPEFKNFQKAYEYAQIAARKGVMEAEYILGMFLYYGRGCVADEDRAYKYFSKAYEHGMAQARLMIERIKGHI